tara:strand:- start:339 stop:974 length:636 start_codon:yes stop_codon:yes gene_type:complete
MNSELTLNKTHHRGDLAVSLAILTFGDKTKQGIAVYTKQNKKVIQALELLNEANNELKIIEKKKDIKLPFRITLGHAIDSVFDSVLGDIYKTKQKEEQQLIENKKTTSIDNIKLSCAEDVLKWLEYLLKHHDLSTAKCMKSDWSGEVRVFTDGVIRERYKGMIDWLKYGIKKNIHNAKIKAVDPSFTKKELPKDYELGDGVRKAYEVSEEE